MTETELRELDAWIELSIFGWKAETVKRYGGEDNVKGFGFNSHLGFGHIDRKFIPNRAFPTVRYSTDPMASRELEKKIAFGQRISLWYSDGTWNVDNLRSCGDTEVQAKTLELAIALFARKFFTTK